MDMSENEKPRQQPSDAQPSRVKNEVPASMRWMRRIKKTFSFFFTCSLLSAHRDSHLSGLFAFPNAPRYKTMQTSQMYDVHGEVIDTFYSGQNRQVVSLNDISPYLIHATLAVEDQQFYDHFGVDIKASSTRSRCECPSNGEGTGSQARSLSN